MNQGRRTSSSVSDRVTRTVRMQGVEAIMVREGTAARLLDMQPGEFRSLVEAGALPRPRRIFPGVERWYVPDLKAIANGAALEEEFEP